ncbi:hypothetical protein DVJ78_15785 [Humibacter sp. BT305]|nr:hypothetical protein DVJ78_15785 [Humibacter sp. BT305]
MQSKRSRVAAAAFIAAGVAVVVNGCTLLEAVDPPIQSAIYATGAEAKASSTIPAPTWVPDDASMVRVKANSDSGAELMQFTVASPLIVGGPCSVPASQDPPVLDDTWWVQALPTDDLVNCEGDWYVFASGSVYYAWIP